MDTSLACEVETASGRRYLWHPNAPTPNDRPSVSPNFAAQRGTGFASGGVTLRRQIGRDWPDMTLGDTVRLIGADGSIAYEGWITALPRTTEGGDAIRVELAGFMALAQDEPFQETYRTSDLGRWQPMSGPRRQGFITSKAVNDHSIDHDEVTGDPTLNLHVDGDWIGAFPPWVEGWFEMPSDRGGQLHTSYAPLATTGSASWGHQLWEADDEAGTGLTLVATLNGNSSGTVNATISKRWALLVFFWGAATSNTAPGVFFGQSHSDFAAYGAHGLPVRGTEPAAGFYVSDLIRDMASRWAPQLDRSGIQDTSYIIRDADYREPTYLFNAWQDLNRFHLWELGVYENKRLIFEPPSSLDEWDWEIRASDPGASVNLEGDQFPFNGVLVTYTDLRTGRTRTIGPDDYPELFDSSEANPATSHRRRRFFPTTAPFPCLEPDAVQIGRARFAEAIRAQARGSIRTGPKIRDRAGNEHPAWRARPGQRLIISDLPNDRPRRIAQSAWNGNGATLETDNISRRVEAILDARVPAARAAAGLA